jgi:hypothetical protein
VDRRVAPNHAHLGPDGFFYCDTGYGPSADHSECIPQQLAPTTSVESPPNLAPATSIQGLPNSAGGGRAEVYAPPKH